MHSVFLQAMMERDRARFGIWELVLQSPATSKCDTRRWWNMVERPSRSSSQTPPSSVKVLSLVIDRRRDLVRMTVLLGLTMNDSRL